MEDQKGISYVLRGTRRFVCVLLVFSFYLLPCQAQWDTIGLRLHNISVGPAATSTALMAAGSLLTFSPAANTLALTVRDEVTGLNLPRLQFDNYLQYLPAALPLTLKLGGVKSRHTFGHMALLEGGSYLLGAGWVNAFKYGIGILRPDNTTYNSFPSGHTFMAFTGAELLRREYGKDYPWIAVAGYTMATVVALMRVYNNRHWVGDVLAGAGMGIMSVTLVYWALD